MEHGRSYGGTPGRTTDLSLKKRGGGEEKRKQKEEKNGSFLGAKIVSFPPPVFPDPGWNRLHGILNKASRASRNERYQTHIFINHNLPERRTFRSFRLLSLRRISLRLCSPSGLMIDVIAWKQSKGPKSGSEITQPVYPRPYGTRGAARRGNKTPRAQERVANPPFPCVRETRDLETSYNRRVTVTGFNIISEG